MDKIKEMAVKVKNHVVRNKVAYACGTVAALAITAQVRNTKAIDKFLKEKGIDPMEFYFPEGYEELSKTSTPA